MADRPTSSSAREEAGSASWWTRSIVPIAPRDRLGRRTAAAFGILLLVFAASTAAMAAIPGNDGSGGSWEDTR